MAARFFNEINFDSFAEVDFLWGFFQAIPEGLEAAKVFWKVIWDGPDCSLANEEFLSLEDNGNGGELDRSGGLRDKAQSVEGSSLAGASIGDVEPDYFWMVG